MLHPDPRHELVFSVRAPFGRFFLIDKFFAINFYDYKVRMAMAFRCTSHTINSLKNQFYIHTNVFTIAFTAARYVSFDCRVIFFQKKKTVCF